MKPSAKLPHWLVGTRKGGGWGVVGYIGPVGGLSIGGGAAMQKFFYLGRLLARNLH